MRRLNELKEIKIEGWIVITQLSVLISFHFPQIKNLFGM